MNDEQALKKIGREWDAAIAKNDVDPIGKVMSDDWVIVGSDGITTKESFLQSIRVGDLVHAQMNFEDVHVKIQGDTGVVVSRGTSAGTYKGQPFSFHEWSTSTYVRDAGTWRCILTMLTPVK
jgi:ketosteroid isomerase-like protein